MMSTPTPFVPRSPLPRRIGRSALRRSALAAVLLALAFLSACSGTWKGLSDDASSIFGDEEEETETEEVRVEQVREVVSIAELQQLLDEQGYDPGPVDGVFGDRTGRAIRSYQVNNGLKVTGRPSAALVERLRTTSGAPSEPIPE
jgi:hypothetical protein